ncbi:MAG: nucleotidyl transferase AbiEii/AbiGii toxin family protein [Candidatus Margulisiibacteriota bacterium]
MIPNLTILPDEQKLIWPLLKATPKDFVLYGGTAIALRLGHRVSIDFDFFSRNSFIPDALYSQIPYLSKSDVIQKGLDTLSCLIPINNTTVKISFFGGLNLKQINSPDYILENDLKIASLLDLFGMKCSTVCTRIEKKDYLDIYAIISQSNLNLYQGLAAAKAIYTNQYHPLMTLKALSCFEGGDLQELDNKTKEFLLKQVDSIDLNKIPEIQTEKFIGDE